MAAITLKPWHRLGCTLVTVLCMQAALAQDKAAPAAPAPAAAPAAAPVPAPAPAPAAAPAATASPVMPSPAPVAAAAAAPAEKPAAAEAPKKKRYIARRRSSCTLLDDPWDNLCVIQKKAQIACSDLPAGKRKVAMRNKRGMPPPVIGNPRKECVDAYMRNV